MMEVNRDVDAVPRASRILDVGAIGHPFTPSWREGAHDRPMQLEIGRAVLVVVSSRAYGNLEEARRPSGYAQVPQDRGRSGFGHSVDRGDPGCVLFIHRVARDGPRIGSVHTIGRVVFAGNSVADTETGAVLDRQVSVKKASQLDDNEDDQEHDREDKGELHHALAAKSLSPCKEGFHGWQPHLMTCLRQ
jgi:hypothetical protein